jgi:hypothetical protein
MREASKGRIERNSSFAPSAKSIQAKGLLSEQSEEPQKAYQDPKGLERMMIDPLHQDPKGLVVIIIASLHEQDPPGLKKKIRFIIKKNSHHHPPSEGGSFQVIELPLLNPELFLRVGIKPPKGVLLYGPPGTGKTLLARAVASTLDCNFLKVVSSAIVDKYIGESARLIREMFGRLIWRKS